MVTVFSVCPSDEMKVYSGESKCQHSYNYFDSGSNHLAAQTIVFDTFLSKLAGDDSDVMERSHTDYDG